MANEGWIDLLRSGNVTGVGQAYDDGYQQGQQIGQKRILFNQQQAGRAAIAQALKTGDYQGAAAAAYAAGDDKSGTGFTALAKNRADQQKDATSAWANFNAGLSATPYEARRAVIQANKPALMARGYSSADIDAFDPTDGNIQALSGLDYSQEKRDEHAIASGNLAVNQQNADTQRIQATNPVTIAPGGSLVGRDGSELYRSPQVINAPMDNNVYEVGQAGAAPDGAGSGSKTGILNSDWAKRQPGYIPGDGKYAQFQPGYAERAQASLIRNNYVANGQNTVSSIIAGKPGPDGHRTHGYSPSVADGGDNPQANTDNYIAFVAQRAGIDPNAPIPPAQMPAVLAAMRQWESGSANGSPSAPRGGLAITQIQTGVPKGGSGADGSMDPAAIHSMAIDYINTGKLPALGNGSAGLKMAIQSEVANVLHQNGLSPDDLGAYRANYHARSTALTNQKKVYESISASESNALQAMDNLIAARERVGVGNHNRLVTGAVMGVRRFANDPDIQALDTYAATVQSEYSKVMTTTSGGGNTPLTDSARHDMDRLLNSNGSVESMKAARDAMAADMHARTSSWQKSIDGLDGELRTNLDRRQPASSGPIRAPRNAVDALRRNPALAGAFDQKYGPGASRLVLGR